MLPFYDAFLCFPRKYRPHQDLQEEFARELPRDLETLTFAFGFDRAIIEVDWPPRIKAINFGDSFNPRGEPSAARGRPVSAVSEGVGAAGRAGGRGVEVERGMGNRGSGGNKDWAKFLPTGLEEIRFGTCFNQPVVSLVKSLHR